MTNQLTSHVGFERQVSADIAWCVRIGGLWLCTAKGGIKQQQSTSNVPVQVPYTDSQVCTFRCHVCSTQRSRCCTVCQQDKRRPQQHSVHMFTYSVRQKVGIKNWELQNSPRIDHACFYNSCYVDPYGLDRCGLEPCLASKPEQPEQSERLHSARKSKGCIKKTYGFRRHPRGAGRLTKQAAFNFATLFVSIWPALWFI